MPLIVALVVVFVVEQNPPQNFANPNPLPALIIAVPLAGALPAGCQTVVRGAEQAARGGNGCLSFVLIIIVTTIMFRQTHTLLAVTAMKPSH